MASQTETKQAAEPNVGEMDARTRARYQMMANLDDEDDDQGDTKNSNSTGATSNTKNKTGKPDVKPRQQRKPASATRVDASGRPIPDMKQPVTDDVKATSKVDPSISEATTTRDDELKQAQDEILSVLKQASSVSQLQAKLNQTPQAKAAIGDMVNEKIQELKQVKVQTDAQRNETIEYRKTMMQWRKCKTCGASHAPSPTVPMSAAATGVAPVKKSDKSRKPESKTKDAGTKVLPLKQCARCRNAWYCSIPCQRKGYAMHQPICKLISQKVQGVEMPELEVDIIDESNPREWDLIQQGKAKPRSQQDHDAFMEARKKFNDFFLSWLNRKEMVFSGMFYPSGKVYIVLPNANVEEELPSSAVVAILDLNLGTVVTTDDTASAESIVETAQTSTKASNIIDDGQENILPEIDTTKKNATTTDDLAKVDPEQAGETKQVTQDKELENVLEVESCTEETDVNGVKYDVWKFKPQVLTNGDGSSSTVDKMSLDSIKPTLVGEGQRQEDGIETSALRDSTLQVETRDETVKKDVKEAGLKDKYESKMEEVPYEQPKPFGKMQFFDAHFKATDTIGNQTYFNFMQLRACLGDCGHLSTGRNTLCMSPSQAKGLQVLSGGTNAIIVGAPNSGKTFLANRWADVNGHKKDAVLLADNVSSLANLDNLFAQAEDKPLSQCIFILTDPNLITKKQAKDEGFIIIGLDAL